MHAGFELIALWSEKMVENSLEMAELENASPHEAEKWIVFPNLSSHLYDLLLIVKCMISVFSHECSVFDGGLQMQFA